MDKNREFDTIVAKYKLDETKIVGKKQYDSMYAFIDINSKGTLEMYPLDSVFTWLKTEMRLKKKVLLSHLPMDPHVNLKNREELESIVQNFEKRGIMMDVEPNGEEFYIVKDKKYFSLSNIEIEKLRKKYEKNIEKVRMYNNNPFEYQPKIE